LALIPQAAHSPIIAGETQITSLRACSRSGQALTSFHRRRFGHQAHCDKSDDRRKQEVQAGASGLPVTWRSQVTTSCAVPPKLAIASFGGTAQLVVTWLLHVTGNPLAPAWYLLLAAIVGLVAMSLMPETAPVKQRQNKT